jgi:hypothetical protein
VNHIGFGKMHENIGVGMIGRNVLQDNLSAVEILREAVG